MTTSSAPATATTGTATPSPTDLDCSDFATQPAAQAELVRNPRDPHNLDADNDGTACEALAGGLAEDNTALGGATAAPATTAVPTAGLSVQDLDCSDFATQPAAQAELVRNPRDPHNLDADNDGTACEALGNGLAEDNTALLGSAATTTTAAATTPAASSTATATRASAAALASQVVLRPAGGVGAGDGSTADGGSGATPYAIGALALVGAGGAAVASRRSSRRSA